MKKTKTEIKLFVLLFILTSVIALLFPPEGHAVPAAPLVHTLGQPDGTIFNARQWGDESYHGWETEEGYTIVFDEGLNRWTYAIPDQYGNLVSSSRIVGLERPPIDVPGHIRPAIQALRMLPVMRLDMEVAPQVVSPAGTANIPVIEINFNNTTTTYTSNDFNTLLFGTSNNSMKDYYEEVSYGVFTVSPGPGGVAGWYTASNTHNYYGQNFFGSDRWPGTLVREAVAAADAAGFNFAPYDQDGDCYVDVINIIHQGSGEEASGVATDIWSHRWNLNSAYSSGRSNGGAYSTNDNCTSNPAVKVKVNDYVIQPETLYGQISTMGVFTHEYGHALGLPDLYDTDYSSNGIGDWSLMAGGSWNGVTRPGDRPAHLDPWCKYQLGWVVPTQVSGALTNEPIDQAATYADVYKLGIGTPLSGEYFLLENRQKTGFDAALPGAGLLVWHIDGNTISGKINLNTVNNSECYPGGPSCALNHFGVAVVQADNLWELEKNIDSGDTGDPFPGSTAKTSFTNSTLPNSNLYNGSASGVGITNIGASGPTMTADLSAPATIVRIEEDNPAITYTGSWTDYTCSSCSNNGLRYSGQTSARAEFSFNGTGIKWIVARANMMGKARVFLDGVNMGLVDLYSSTTKYQQVLQATGLTAGNHTVAIEVSGQKNASSTGYYIDLDAFEVLP